jgi:hypothetical protein
VIKKNLDLRIVFALLAIAIGFGSSYLPTRSGSQTTLSHNFPAQVCPAINAAGSTTSYLPATKLGVRSVDGKSTSFSVSSRSAIPSRGNPILVDSNAGISISSSTLPGSGIAAVPCSPGSPDEWFIGGSGGLTSKGILYLANSGLSESTVDIFAFTSKVALPVHSVKVKANSTSTLSLDALAPGDENIALHIVTRTGRISTFVLDQRAKGLSALGLDYVKPTTPSKDFYISALYPHSGDKSSVINSLRLLVPDALDATIRVEAISTDGKFIPVGFDGLSVKHGQVVTIPLKNLTTTGPFGLHIQSDQPIVASALTTVGSGDFAWAAPSPALADTGMNFGGATPVICALGTEIRFTVTGKYSNGKSFSQIITGSDIAIWAPKIGVNSLRFTVPRGSNTYVGALVTGGGLTYLPVAPGVSVENTALPFNDVHTLTH